MNGYWSPKAIGSLVFVNGLVFIQGCSVYVWQYFALVLWPISQQAYYQFINLVMSIWGLTLMFLIDTFCPASFVLNIDPSCNTDTEPMLQKDKQDKTIGLSMPKRAIVIANHQVMRDKDGYMEKRERCSCLNICRSMPIGFTFGVSPISPRHKVRSRSFLRIVSNDYRFLVRKWLRNNGMGCHCVLISCSLFL